MQLVSMHYKHILC